MKTHQLLLRVPVVIVSLMLMIAYVYTQSGGSWPWRTSEPATIPPPEIPAVGYPASDLLPGSKSALVVATEDIQLLPGSKSYRAIAPVELESIPVTEKTDLIYGSKSAPVFLPSEPPDPNALTPIPNTANSLTPVQPTQLLPGSKSLILVDPAKIQQVAPKSGEQAQQIQQPRQLLPGSKSKMLVEPAQLQPAVKQSPNQPAQQSKR